MRLLQMKGDDFSLIEHVGSNIPPYAILSHTWGADEEEVTFKDISDGTGKSKVGYHKIRFCGEQAARNGLPYFWVDTCCIDKSSSAELSEAINSMFRWYQNATRCYVYLPDVSVCNPQDGDSEWSPRWKPEFRRSKWFTRGWTLQELIAPASVEFFSKEEQILGNKQTLEQTLHEITGINVQALRKRPLSQFSVKDRMSWAEKRQTKREEDEAYCLLGIFDIHMPLIYGEGRIKALSRLQKEIEVLSEEPPLSKPTISTERTKGRYESLVITSNKVSNLQEDICTTNRIEITGENDASEETAKIRKELHDLLFFDHIDERLMSLKAAHSRTCKWFLNTAQYESWMNAELSLDHGFLWIKGKPGAGKSTLMKFLDTKAKAKAKSNPNCLVASFFFNARGEQLEMSTTGLYRSLLWQLFENAADLRIVLDELGTNAKHIIRHKGWQIEVLKQILVTAVEHLGNRTLQLFVDALDECDDKDVTDMISFFEEIGERAIDAKVRLRICFSSRHYPTVIIRCGKQIVLEDEEEHDHDITRYIKSTLKLANPKKADSLMSQILEKADGVFLWVALVIPILNKASAQGRVEELQNCLNGIPPELDGLFGMILTRDCEDLHELQLCIQWILFAMRPLRQEEYFFAIRCPKSTNTATSWLSGDVSVEDMHRFIHSTSKGLAQVTKTRSKDKAPTVQFIHETVRDFFLAKNGYLRLWPTLSSQFAVYSHKTLRDRCMAEINISHASSTITRLLQPSQESSQIGTHDVDHASIHEALPKANSPEALVIRKSVSEELPFLEYAVKHVLYHADATKSDVTAHASPPGEFSLKYWIYLNNVFERFQIRRYTSTASLLYILAEKNLPKLIRHELTQIPSMDIYGERHDFPMFAACVNGNRDAIATLLMQESSPRCEQNLALHIDRLCEMRPRQSWTILSCAAQKGEECLIELLLKTGKVEINAKDTNGQTSLSLAAHSGYETIIKLLLETGQVEVDVKDIHGQTPLWWAAHGGHEAVVKLLLDTGQVEVDVKDIHGRTPLSLAAGRGHEAVLKLLRAKMDLYR
jgi:hypothetical protein